MYIEEEALHYPLTSFLLDKNPNAVKIEVKNYKHIFNRPSQSFLEQKESMKLILAVKKDNYYYPATKVVNNYGYENFYYNTLILNCVYNCEYCYLQGMFNSANIVIFVNIEDFFRETEKLLADNSIYLCLSYETDLLAFEDLIPYTNLWIEFARKHPNLVIEIRTKSNQYKKIQELKPIPNVILAWTISPDEIIKKYEKKTPTLNRRLEDITSALKDGWNVRICLDPILHVKNWKQIYSEFIEKAFSTIPIENIWDISIGSFRINADYLKRMKKIKTTSDILHYPFDRFGSLNMYPEKKSAEIISFIMDKVAKYISPSKLFPSQ
ncbi:MAG: radical SAM protein [Leptospiraceae bacterium]|nr:radical SAM protein [Leptospiraceae bacterium]